MVYGVHASLAELIQLRRYAQVAPYKPEGKALRSGMHRSRLRGRGMDFTEVRQYQAGDEIRHMEWRITARTGEPHVKLYQEERERPVVLLVDFNPSMIFGTRVAFKSVVAARLAGLLAWTVVTQGDRIGGFFFSAQTHREFMPRARESGVLPLLAALSKYTEQTDDLQQTDSRKLSEALIRLRRVVRPGSIIVLISDFYAWDVECEQHLNRLAAHNDMLAYHIADPVELHAPAPEHYAITDGTRELILDTRQTAVRSAYEAYCQHRMTAIQEYCKRLGMQYVLATAQDDVAQLVRQTFPRRRSGA